MAQSIVTNDKIRLFLQDKPQFNSLVDGCRWSDEMINEAILSVCDFYNITNPPSNVWVSAESYPSRYLLIRGVAGYLLSSASINEASNNLTYSENGVQINDKDKAEIFKALGKELWDEHVNMVTNLKTNQNLSQCYGRKGSDWGRIAFP
jgi:hypothetical protein